MWLNIKNKNKNMQKQKITNREKIVLLLLTNVLIYWFALTPSLINRFSYMFESTHAVTTERVVDEVVPVEEDENLDIKQVVMAMVSQAGLDPFEAYAIIQCESGWNPEAYNINTNRTADFGLWEINSIHKNISTVDKFDPVKSTEWAINKRLHDKNWSAWVCANNLGI